MENRFHSYSTYFLAEKTNEIVLEIGDWIETGQEEDGQTFTPETCLRRVPFIGMVSDLQRNRKKAEKLQDTERNAAYFWTFKPGHFEHTGPGSEKTWNFEKYPVDQRGQCDELAKQVTDVFFCTEASNFDQFPERRMKKSGENMLFSASDSSVKMMMDLISSANDF